MSMTTTRPPKSLLVIISACLLLVITFFYPQLNASASASPSACALAIESNHDSLISSLLSSPHEVWSWVFEPQHNSQVSKQVEQVLNMTETKKEAALREINKTPISFKENPKLGILKMLLNDRNTWMEYIQIVLEYGDQGGWLFDSLYRPLQKLPPPLKHQILRFIADNYSHANKTLKELDDELASKWKKVWISLPPKRGFDSIIRALLPPEKIVADFIHAGLTPEAAFDNYINQIQDLFQGTPFGGYDGQQIRKTLSALQDYERKNLKSILGTTVHSQITVQGSFVSGRAKLDDHVFPSDIDITYYPKFDTSLDNVLKIKRKDITNYLAQSSPEEIQRTDEDFQLAFDQIRPGFESSLQHIFLPSTHLELSGHSGLDFSIYNTARVNPIIFLVSPDRIQLVIFKPIFSTLENPDIFANNYEYDLYELSNP